MNQGTLCAAAHSNARRWIRRVALAALTLASLGHAAPTLAADPVRPALRAGAAMVDISPTKFPCVVNGMFEERYADKAYDPVCARALVLEDGAIRIAIVVVDSLMITREMIDEAKQVATKGSGIPVENMLVSATHTHSAPSVMGCLGSGVDPDYPPILVRGIARAIEQAAAAAVPARVGWTVAQAPDLTHCRRWIRRPDKLLTDPFGTLNVRANMHPGYQNPDAIGPAGPDDPDLSLLAVQTADGKPLAVLGNFAMHYYGSPLVSADVCGRFGEKLAPKIGAEGLDRPFVGLLSQGTSGDNMWMDYSQPQKNPGLDGYTDALATIAAEAYRKIEYHSSVPLAMREARLTLSRRIPTTKRLAWAKDIVAKQKGKVPRGMQEIYAHEQIYLHNEPQRELKLQAIRIGELAITAIPDEVYAITGLKLKQHSPFAQTFTIELANGAEGYIPPPEQHALGGYTTWPARTAGLDRMAEPQIVATLVKLLEELAGKPARPIVEPQGVYALKVLEAKPAAYWRMADIAGRSAVDAVDPAHGGGEYEDGVARYLDGPPSTNISRDAVNRAAHFAGGRMRAKLPELGETYSVELWFWNGLPVTLREVTGYLFSRGPDGDKAAAGDHLGIGGTHAAAGKLIFFNGNAKNQLIAGVTPIQPKTWNQVVLVRQGKQVRIYLNGNPKPEAEGEADITVPTDTRQIFVGGRNDNLYNFEGKIDEVSLYRRALTPEEITEHYKLADVLAPQGPLLSPADSQKLIQVRDGYSVDLLAAEPLVFDPVAFDWDGRGRLWVVEMADYPLGMDNKGKPGGRIRILEDADGDGRYDRSTLFADGLSFPNGILLWRKGVLVTAAPDILYLEDNDGDDKADVRRPLFSGFLEANQQLRVNGLRWGLDNWVYCANGGVGNLAGQSIAIKSHVTGEVVTIGQRDFRIKPDEGLIDPQAGQAQFGRNRDDWGNWFGCMNSFPVWHVVLHDHYTRRNPLVAPPDPILQLVLPRNPRIYPAKQPEKRFHSFNEANCFTSACSVMVYRDELLFPRDGLEHSFTCEPFHNLVHHEVLTPHGVTFTAKRAAEEQQIEFLASADQCFRPVMVRTGLDGAVWVADMYRFMIEHPQWLPENGKAELEPNYRTGDQQGRIYRLYASDRKPRAIPKFADVTVQELVALLNSPNGELRDKAQQQLVWRNETAAVPLLETLAAKGTEPLARLHALCTLDGLKQLRPDALIGALSDKDPAVRAAAIRLAEPRSGESSELVTAALARVGDADPRVQMQLAGTLGMWHDPRVGEALAQVALNSAGDPYITAYVLSSLTKENLDGMLTAVLAKADDSTRQTPLIGQLLALAAAMGRNEVTVETLRTTLEPGAEGYRAWQYSTVANTLDALARHGSPVGQLVGTENGKAVVERLKVMSAQAAKLATDTKAAEADRAAAVRLLAREPSSLTTDVTVLGELLVPQTPLAVQSAIIAHLALQTDPAVATALLAGWKSHAPAVRSQIISALLSRQPWVLVLLDQLEAGAVLPGDIDAVSRTRLSRNPDQKMRPRIEKLLATSASADRQKVLADWQPALKLVGKPVAGEAVYKKKCAVCHKQGDVGFEVGPNLASLTDKRSASLLVAILDPSQAVEPKYGNYVVVTNDGRSFSGILESETGSSLTLLAQEGKRQVILRQDVEALQGTGKSLMPDGLEKDLTPQDVADLIAYLGGK